MQISRRVERGINRSINTQIELGYKDERRKR